MLYLEFPKNMDRVPTCIPKVMREVLQGRCDDAQNVEYQAEEVGNWIDDVVCRVPNSGQIVHCENAPDIVLSRQSHP